LNVKPNIEVLKDRKNSGGRGNRHVCVLCILKRKPFPDLHGVKIVKAVLNSSPKARIPRMVVRSSRTCSQPSNYNKLGFFVREVEMHSGLSSKRNLRRSKRDQSALKIQGIDLD
jgi:hypothetical protein